LPVDTDVDAMAELLTNCWEGAALRTRLRRNPDRLHEMLDSYFRVASIDQQSPSARATRKKEETMVAYQQHEVPVAIEGDGVQLRKQAIGGDMSVAFVRARKGVDLRPGLKGLPDDRCQCPHWGYLLKGTVRMHTRDGYQDYSAGQAFYWAPGHAPEILEDAEYVDFSPTAAFDAVIAHLTGQTSV
jgi:hypothetical protein